MWSKDKYPLSFSFFQWSLAVDVGDKEGEECQKSVGRTAGRQQHSVETVWLLVRNPNCAARKFWVSP